MAKVTIIQKTHPFHFCSFVVYTVFHLLLDFKARTLNQSPRIRLSVVVLNDL